MKTMEDESAKREHLRDMAPELYAALRAMVDTHNGPPSSSTQRGARLFAAMILMRVER